MSYKTFLIEEILEVVTGVLSERLDTDTSIDLEFEIMQRVGDLLQVLP